MGRKRNSYVRDYFCLNSESGISLCKICGLELQGSYVCNLKRHLLKEHYELYMQETEELNENNEEVLYKKRKFSIQLSTEQVVNACVDIVTKESEPFSLLDCGPFRVLTGQIFDGLNIPVINSRNIMHYVSEKYNNLKNMIIKKCNKRMISVKMDTATRLDRSVLGVNIQMIIDSEIVIYTLTMKELTGRHTAEMLREMMDNIFEEFKIKRQQIYCITTDNGRNMLKAVQAMNEEDPDIPDELDEDIDVTDSVIEDLYNGEENIISIKCAAHTLQLAVKDFFSQIANGILSRARDLVKVLRTPSKKYSLKLLGLQKPILDVCTRWNSTYDMLKRLLKYKTFCDEELEAYNLSEEEWQVIINIVKVLQPVYVATMELQQNQLVLGDFYKTWINLKLQIKHQNTNIAKTLINCLENREEALMQNDALNAAIYLDPRLKRILNSERKAKAKKHLKCLATRMLSLNEIDKNSELSEESTSSTISQDSTLTRVTNDLTTLPSSVLQNGILDMEAESCSDDEIEGNNISELTTAFQEIDGYNAKRMDINSNIMTYWEEKRYENKYLAKLAKIVHAVPATQVSVERSFSSLKLLMSDRRYNLSTENLEKLIFVKLNNK